MPDALAIEGIFADEELPHRVDPGVDHVTRAEAMALNALVGQNPQERRRNRRRRHRQIVTPVKVRSLELNELNLNTGNAHGSISPTTPSRPNSAVMKRK